MEEIFIYASENGNPVIVLASDAKNILILKAKAYTFD
jgi:hypothetical protein